MNKKIITKTTHYIQEQGEVVEYQYECLGNIVKQNGNFNLDYHYKEDGQNVNVTLTFNDSHMTMQNSIDGIKNTLLFNYNEMQTCEYHTEVMQFICKTFCKVIDFNFDDYLNGTLCMEYLLYFNHQYMGRYKFELKCVELEQ